VVLSYGNVLEYVVGFLGTLAAGGTVFPISPRLTEAERVDAARRSGAVAYVGADAATSGLEALGLRRVICEDLLGDPPAAAGADGRRPAGTQAATPLGDSRAAAGADGRRPAGTQAATPLGDSRAAAGADGRRPAGTQAATPVPHPSAATGGVGARLLLQSSGTTGPPRIVERSGRSLDAVARNVAEAVGLRADDRVLGATAIHHSYSIENVLLAPIWAGCTAHLCPGIAAFRATDPRVEPAITVIPGVPALFEMLTASAAPAPFATGRTQTDREGARTHPERVRTDTGTAESPGSPLRAVRRAYSAGATLPRQVVRAMHERFGLHIGQLYGMTEIGSVTFNDPDEPDHDPMSVGRPMSGVRIRVVDPSTQRLDEPLPPGTEGEVAVSAPSMLTGYLRDDAPVGEPPAAMRDGFLLTGDLGRLDERGRLTITGRIKLVVDVGGSKVNLLEVEQAVCAHESVRECVVVSAAVSATVSRLKAYVVPREGATFRIEEVRAFLKSRLSPHKIPRSFEVRDSFPRSPTGKILRHAL
jgi:long-chain acyl-CoA synthetase